VKSWILLEQAINSTMKVQTDIGVIILKLKNVSKFPSNFLWGSAISSFQAEGFWGKDGQGKSVIDHTRKEQKTTDFNHGVNFYEKYPEDIRLMKELGLKCFRLSISWTRIFPDGNGTVNKKGIDFYLNVIKTLKKNGIEPIVTIYHFDYPQKLVDKYGGWISRKSIDDFVEYANYLFHELGNYVTYWITINEQDHVIKMPDRLGITNSNLTFKDIHQEAYMANHNMSVASAKVISLCHELFSNAKIGPALSYQVYYPKTTDPKDVLASDDISLLTQNYLLDLQCKGRYDPVFIKYLSDRNIHLDYPSNDLEIIKSGKPDFIGVNYYSSDVVEYKKVDGELGKTTGFPIPSEENGVYRKVENPVLKSTKWGWSIDSIGLRISLQRIYRDYGLPIFITENGFSEEEKLVSKGNHETVEDLQRIDYLSKHIGSIQQVISEGIPVIGYCVWSFMDIISGHSGMNKRYGLIYVNRDNFDLKDLRRVKKRSFYWYQKVIKKNGVD